MPFEEPKTEVPKWAWDVINRVCAYFQIPSATRVKWSRKNRTWTTGRAYSHRFPFDRHRRFPYEISIVAGNDEIDTLVVLLHELAHYCAFELDEHHNLRFWNRAFMLFAMYEIPEKHLQRELRYRKTAGLAAENYRR